jgi:hypothetical protein
MGETFSKLPVLQLSNLSKNKGVVGLHKYRFTGGPTNAHVPFHVRMAGLPHLLPQELEKSSELAGQKEGINMGAAGSEEDSAEAVLHRDYQLVITSLGALLDLLTPNVPAARDLTEENLASARTSLAASILDCETCGAIFRVLDYLCGREVPDSSEDFAADSERREETNRPWKRFCRDNCEALRQEAFNNNASAMNTVAYGSQAPHAAVRAELKKSERELLWSRRLLYFFLNENKRDTRAAPIRAVRAPRSKGMSQCQSTSPAKCEFASKKRSKMF